MGIDVERLMGADAYERRGGALRQVRQAGREEEPGGPEYCLGCAWAPLVPDLRCGVFNDRRRPWLDEAGECSVHATPERRAEIERAIEAYACRGV